VSFAAAVAGLNPFRRAEGWTPARPGHRVSFDAALL